MATYMELKGLAENMSSIRKGNLLKYNIDDFAEHLPRFVRSANDAFVAANHGVPGVLDYDMSGFTEPEDERDCYANNQALARLDEVIPYLEKINPYLKEGYTESSGYSMHLLHLCDELLEAKQHGLSDEAIDYMCTHAIPRDAGFFGCKHYEYDTYDARIRFQDGMSVEEVSQYQAMDLSLRQIVDFYRDDCRRKDCDIDPSVVALLASAYNSGEAYGLYDAIRDGVENGGLTVAQAKGVHDAIGCLLNEPNDGFETMRCEGYVQSFAEIITQDATSFEFFDRHPEKLMTLALDFKENSSNIPWISDYYDKYPDRCCKNTTLLFRLRSELHWRISIFPPSPGTHPSLFLFLLCSATVFLFRSCPCSTCFCDSYPIQPCL